MLKPQFSLTFVKQPKTRKDETTTAPQIDWDVVGQAAAIFQQTTETAAKVAFAAYAGKKLIDTLSEIAVLAAKAKL